MAWEKSMALSPSFRLEPMNTGDLSKAMQDHMAWEMAPPPSFRRYSEPTNTGNLRKAMQDHMAGVSVPEPLISKSSMRPKNFGNSEVLKELFKVEGTPSDLRKTRRGRNIIIVTPKGLLLANYPNIMKAEEERFPEEEAVCKFCFGTFETQNMFMRKCNCPKALLIHKECIIKSARNGKNKCNVCEQKFMVSFPVKWRRESIS